MSPKFTPERAAELTPLPGTMSHPKVNGKTLYQRIPIQKRTTVAARTKDGRLFVGEMYPDTDGHHRLSGQEVHPETLPEAIVGCGTVRVLEFGKSYILGNFEMPEEGGKQCQP